MTSKFKHILIIFFALIFGISFAQPILVNSTASSGNVSSLKVSFTTSSNANRVLIVSVTSKEKNITSVKYGTTSLTEIAMLSQNSMRSGLYYLVAPNTGTANVVIAVASSTNVSATISEYRNVEQSAPFSNTASTKGKSNSPSLTLTSSNDEIILSSISSIQENPTPGAGMTQISESTSGGSYNNFSRKAGASSVTVNYSFASGNEDDWVIVAGSIKAATTSLPVEFQELTVTRTQDNTVTLNWSTASEVNNHFFEIEQSTDGVNFTSIGKVLGKGNSNQINHYSFENENSGDETTYYRLTQVDFDGTKTYLKTVGVEKENLRTEQLIYNSFSNEITVSQIENFCNYKLYVYNGIGSVIK